MRSVSKYKEISQYWAKHNRKIVNKARHATEDGEGLPKETIKNFFVAEAEAYIEEDGLSANEAIEKVLRGREFKTVSDFYAEGVIENLKADFAKEIGWTGKRFRNSKGQFTSDKFKELRYDGEVMIDDTVWKVYKMPTANGDMIYYYETGSPKMNTFKTFVSEVRYE